METVGSTDLYFKENRALDLAYSERHVINLYWE